MHPHIILQLCLIVLKISLNTFMFLEIYDVLFSDYNSARMYKPIILSTLFKLTDLAASCLVQYYLFWWFYKGLWASSKSYWICWLWFRLSYCRFCFWMFKWGFRLIFNDAVLPGLFLHFNGPMLLLDLDCERRLGFVEQIFGLR